MATIIGQRRLLHAVTYVLLGIGAMSMALPYVWMIVTSVKPVAEIQTFPPSFMVHNPTIQPYLDLFRLIPMGRYLFNSIFVASTVAICNVFFCSLAGYAFAKHRFWGREQLFLIIVGSMMIPWQINIIPGFVIIKKLGWLNTYYALIVPNMVGAFGVFLTRQHISTIPNDLIDAARIDGCGEFRIFRLVVYPLIKPVLAALAIFSFLAQWNSFVWPLVTIYSSDMRTIPLALSVLNGQYGTDFGNNFAMVMAGAVVVTLPVLVVFVIFQRFFIKGIALTGLKF